MKAEDLFERLWIQYSCENPSAGRIYDLFKMEGERVINDHIAFRTFSDRRVNIEVLAKPFLDAGFIEKGTYIFEKKKLKAKHYELPGNQEAPRVFISELMLDQFSEELNDIVSGKLNELPAHIFRDKKLILSGSIFKPVSYKTYEKLRSESEYAAWLYVHGFRANHFTVSVNYLEKMETLQKVNQFLKDKGFKLNESGGEIKGTPEELLEQSSTLADEVDVKFEEGIYRIPKCYYEFARRYPDNNGDIFSGFISKSADKIFESTDFRKN